MTVEPFVPPPYPYDRLVPLSERAAAFDGGAVDCSVGTPMDEPPPEVAAALADPRPARSYPPSIGTAAYREAATGWMRRRLGVDLPIEQVAATIGSKEFVTTLPHLLRLRAPERDTVLFPAVSYPSYAMGARLAGCRAVPVAMTDEWQIDLGSIDPQDASRALCCWVNTPGNPAGGLDDLVAVADWGRANDVPVVSDECYVEFTWKGPRRTILEAGDAGVLAVHSLSKRSNLAGARAGFYAGDAALVHYLSEVRKHIGCMVPGPTQAAAAVALGDDGHVDEQLDRYRSRLQRLIGLLGRLGVDAEMPHGAFYLWVAAPDGDGWGLAARLAEQIGLIVSPGEFYGPAGAGHVRIAAVQPDEALDLLERRCERVGAS